MYASVVVDIKSDNLDTTYTYLLPNFYQDIDLIGCRVLVEFGTQKVLGFILSISETTTFKGNLKPILEILDFNPELNEEQIKLASYISYNTMCTLTQALQAMVPSFLRKKARKYLNIIDYEAIDADLGLLFGGKKKVLLNEQLLKVYPKIKKEISKGNIELAYDTYQYGKLKKVKEYYLLENYDESLISSTKRKEVVKYLFAHPYTTMSTLLGDTSVSELIVRTLEKLKVIGYREIDKVRDYDLYEPSIKTINLSFLQGQILSKYNETNSKPYLLYTNDEVFKYNFLATTIKETLLSERKVLIVCPTILSFINTYKHLKVFLSNYKIIGLNSRTSNSDFYENYMSIKLNNVDIVITTKVGIFLPLQNIGQIIMIDEENYNYLNEQTPKFNSKKVLSLRSSYHNAKLIFTSSTPSFELYHEAVCGKIYLLKYLVDYKNEIKKINIRNTNLINGVSEEIINSIKETYKNNKKSILILNYKGYSRNIVCRKCSEIIKCPKCKIPLTYYKEKNILKCNFCDYKKEHFQMCDHCGSSDLMYLGVGLEQIAEKIALSFPAMRVLQIDSETMADSKKYDETILSIEDENYDIVIGTSMVISLCSSESVGMIALLDADGILNYSDYRAKEECYNIISKTIGFKNTLTYIQGYNLDNSTIDIALKSDYQKFYEDEVMYRKLFKFPPFYECNRMIISGDYKDMYYYANYFKKVFYNVIDGEKEVLGPVYLYKHRGVQLLIKHNNYEKLNKLILEVNKKFEKSKIIVNYERYPQRFN